MDDSFFVFGHNDSFFYWTPSLWNWEGLDPDLDARIRKPAVDKMVQGALGPEKNNFFFSYTKPDGTFSYCKRIPNSSGDCCFHTLWGTGIPKELRTWLFDDTSSKHLADKHVRVSLGPNGSFFACDSQRVRWHSLPGNLDRIIQGWLTPAGWKTGPPRILTLGFGGSYFAMTEYGSTAYCVPGSLTDLTTDWEAVESLPAHDWSNVVYANLSPCMANRYLVVFKDFSLIYNVPGSIDQVYNCLYTVVPPETAYLWREARAKTTREEEAKRDSEEAAKRKREQEREARAKAALERARITREQKLARELPLRYATWQSARDVDLRKDKAPTTFPHLPMAVCICVQISCTSRKTTGSLMACEHDVERFLRASGKYSAPWLREQRLQWHPDRFGRRCDPDFRKELNRKAGELYAIFGILIEAEQSQTSS